MRLADRVVIVTGGAQGIGRAIAARLHEEGATIVVADLQGAEEAAAELGGLGLRVDVSSESDTAAMAAAALERYGRIDGLINNAGIYTSLVPKPFEEISVDEWRKVYDVNVMGMFLAAPSKKNRSAINAIILHTLNGSMFIAHWIGRHPDRTLDIDYAGNIAAGSG